jgi:predicted  nucleic acid-binding Zn-ribbon protein
MSNTKLGRPFLSALGDLVVHHQLAVHGGNRETVWAFIQQIQSETHRDIVTASYERARGIEQLLEENTHLREQLRGIRPVNEEEMAGLRQKIVDLESAGQVMNKQMTELQQRNGDLERAGQVMNTQMAELQQRNGDLEREDQVMNAQMETISQLREQIAHLEERVRASDEVDQKMEEERRQVKKEGVGSIISEFHSCRRRRGQSSDERGGDSGGDHPRSRRTPPRRHHREGEGGSRRGLREVKFLLNSIFYTLTFFHQLSSVNGSGANNAKWYYHDSFLLFLSFLIYRIGLALVVVMLLFISRIPVLVAVLRPSMKAAAAEALGRIAYDNDQMKDAVAQAEAIPRHPPQGRHHRGGEEGSRMDQIRPSLPIVEAADRQGVDWADDLGQADSILH